MLRKPQKKTWSTKLYPDSDKKEEATSILGDSVDARKAEKKNRKGRFDKGHQDRLDAESELLGELKK